MMKCAPILAGVAALTLAAFVAPAHAGGYGHHSWYAGGYGHHGYGHYGHGYYGRGHRRHGSGVSLGFVFAPPPVVYAPPPRVVYTPPPAVVYAPPPAVSDCQQTTGTGYANGRPALFGGTWCRDAYGRGYVVAGSERFLGYLQ